MNSLRGIINRLRAGLLWLWKQMRRITVPGWVRNYRAWVFQVYVLVALVAFSLLAFVADVTEYTEADLEITRTLQSGLPEWARGFMQAVSWPGYAPQVMFVIGGVIILLGIAGLRWELFCAASAALIEGVLNYVVKVAVRRPRPPEDLVDVMTILNSYSFPSGHVMFYTAFFGFLLFLVYIFVHTRWRRYLLMLPLALMIALIGVSRMYLGEHWASDVLAGYLLGSLALSLAIFLYRWGKRRIFPQDPLDVPPVKLPLEEP